jgi:DNA-binding SARP family transcriptional activator/tetratricopeptide (TPR) repeat protein
MGESPGATKVEIRMLGGFEVLLDGTPISVAGWPRPQAATLVKLLALAPGRRLHREQLIERLWPDLTVSEAAPRLHKLAHYARRALAEDRTAIVLRSETVALLPEAEVVVDVDVFEQVAEEALADGTPSAAAAAAARYGGTLLPEDLYETWAENRREHLRLRYRDLLRLAGRWEDLLVEDPADEDAHVALMTQHVEAGDHRAALRQFERMDAALRRELGVGPSQPALAVRDQILAAFPEFHADAGQPSLIGRHSELEQFKRLLADAGRGGGRTVLVSGPPGVGKSAQLEWVSQRAGRAGWRVGQGIAAAVEGAWPYAPVLDALADLCRRHPTLLDGLGDTYRQEIERALAGAELTWSGEGTHQRLFVAAAELLRLAAAGTGLLLAMDDMHEADEASLRLLHYLARSITGERALIVVGHREGGRRVEQIKGSLLRRNLAVHVPLRPLDRQGTDALVRAHIADVSTPTLDHIWEVSGGLPFAVVEMARAPAFATVRRLGALGLSRLAVKTREAIQRVAVIGISFDTDQFVALTGLPEPEAYAALDAALAGLVVVHTGSGYRFRHPLIRDALLDDIPPAQQRMFHQQAAGRLEAIGAPPARIAHHLIAAGQLSAAVPHVIQAVETEAAIGAYRDALTLVDAVRNQADPHDRGRLLALRANLLSALGDRSTIDAYRDALAVAAEPERPLLRARMALSAVREGDLDTAAAVLDGLEPDGGPADVAILLAQGKLAYFRGDIEAAWKASDQVGGLVRPDEDILQRLDLLTLQALIAHHRGELFSRLRLELRRAQDTPALASSVFEPYLCVAEYLLYGTTPYAEVKTIAQSVRDTARRTGVLRAEAFATALLGEAALLAGEIDEAEHALRDAADLHREIGAPSGEAVSLQRLAEVRLLEGDREEANRLLRQALPRARWSMVAPHLVQRIFGTMILAAPDPRAARTVVDQAEDAMGTEDACVFCVIMFAVPAAIACAEVCDLDDARRYLAIAERSSELWEGTSWQAAILEARAHLAWAVQDPYREALLLNRAAVLFEQAGQPLDAARCRERAHTQVSLRGGPARGLAGACRPPSRFRADRRWAGSATCRGRSARGWRRR